jgi:diguanylate cyclase (GGDEF)-like protein
VIHSRRVNLVLDGRKQQILEELVPIRFNAGRPGGALVLWTAYGPIARAARNAFIPISLVLELLLVALFLGLVPMLRRVTRQVRAHLAESQRQALHDDLTGLPNRALFGARLKVALEARANIGGEAAVLLIDLDRFKEINDTLGHSSGDTLLRETAIRLTGVVRDCDTVARLGGDEFGILLPDTSLDEARAIAGRLVEVSTAPFEIDGLSLSVGASTGIALYPQHGRHAATLIKHADVAMYEAKRSGVGYAVYDPRADLHHADLLSLASELRVAMQRSEIVAHYQPVVDLHTNRVESMEALLRWNHPARGLLSAGEFMPLAQQLGLVPSLSEHALLLAVQECTKWQSQGTELTVAVNLDMTSLMDPDLPKRVAALLAEYDLDPRRLELEITETSLMGDQARVLQIATELTAIGVKLAIDDFAAGHTSLRYLVQLPVSKVKIDRSLIARAGAEPERIIIAGIIDIAHNLGLGVVAEGIEDEKTLELMRDLESDFAQGFHLGRPGLAPVPPTRTVSTAGVELLLPQAAVL